MADTLASVLDLLLPGLDPLMVPPAARDWIRPLAERLPPARLGGFEVRLAPESGRVDFQAAWRRDEAGALEEAARSLGCAPLAAFARSWPDPFDEVWLEFDEGSDPSRPCLFLGLDVDAAAPDSSLLAMLEAARGFGVDPPEEAIRGVFASCRGAQRVSHLGLMLSRPEAGVRLNVKRIGPGECGAFLARAGLPPADLPVPDAFDRHVLALDLPQGTAALECGYGETTGDWPWDRLAREGLCPREKARALHGWPEILHPGKTGPWPACLVGPAMAAGPESFALLERRVGHVKIGPGAVAKAYLGFTFYLAERGAEPSRGRQAETSP